MNVFKIFSQKGSTIPKPYHVAMEFSLISFCYGCFLKFWGSSNIISPLAFMILARIFRVGIVLPKIEVQFEHLNIGVDVYIGSRALPSLSNLSNLLFTNMRSQT